LTIRK